MKGVTMRFYVNIILLVCLGFFVASNAMANDKSDYIYGSKIDQMISFYEGRLYLMDSEYKILSDIAKSAEKKISYLKNNRAQLISEMKAKDVNLNSFRIRTFVLGKVRLANLGLGYTQ